MAPPKEENGVSRRKSLNPFSMKASPSFLPRLNTDVENNGSGDGSNIGRRSSIFGTGSATSKGPHWSATMSPNEGESTDPEKIRPRTLQKLKGRPSSMGGAVGKKTSKIMDDLEDTVSMAIDTTTSVLLHGEVQTSTGFFKKKKEYLVLTPTHLFHYKSQSRAAESFPCILTSGLPSRHASSASFGSLADSASIQSHASSDSSKGIRLDQIVTVYKVEDGRPFFTTEVVYLDEDSFQVGSMQLILAAPTEADQWMSSLRAAAQKAAMALKEPYTDKVLDYVYKVIKRLNDYDSNQLRIYRVVRRPSFVKAGKPDELEKFVGTSPFYLAVGVNLVHMIKLPSDPSQLVHHWTKPLTYGIVTLSELRMFQNDDRFEMTFRLPLREHQVFELASLTAIDIPVPLFKSIALAKPLWPWQTLIYTGSSRYEKIAKAERAREMAELEPTQTDNFNSLDRTLNAYCMSYGCDPQNIRYLVDNTVDDAPEFRLLSPAKSSIYSAYELLCVMRALRYNFHFGSISFQGIDLHSIYCNHDSFGYDHVAFVDIDGTDVRTVSNHRPEERSLLYQEVQAIALSSKSLRRLDFRDALPRRRLRDAPSGDHGDPGSEIAAAILHLCAIQMTNVTWVDLSGIELGEVDILDMAPALSDLNSRIRAIVCSRSALCNQMINRFLKALEPQGANIEFVNIAGNPGRLSFERFHSAMSNFTHIRSLNLSGILRTQHSSELPLLPPGIIRSWQLEYLNLSGIMLNDVTVTTLSDYLAHGMSDSLQTLDLVRCSLTGTHAASLFHSMVRVPGEHRNLRLNISNNYLENDIGDMLEAIKDNETPSHLIIRTFEFEKELNFKRFLDALRENTTIQSLDISKTGLPQEAGHETCQALKSMFLRNNTIKELDISGEKTRMEARHFGTGLCQALTGLKHNTALRSLRIEYQNLGYEGGHVLASVLKSNKGLTHVHCAHNEYGLQAFNAIVDAMEKNHNVVELPFMMDDQRNSIKKIAATIADVKRVSTLNQKSVRPFPSTSSAINPLDAKPMTKQDTIVATTILEDEWTKLNIRLATFLRRNQASANGGGECQPIEEESKPSGILSEEAIVRQVLNETTPRAELGNPVDDQSENLAGIDISGNTKLKENNKTEVSSNGSKGGEIAKKLAGIPSSEVDIGQVLKQNKMTFEFDVGEYEENDV